MPKSPRSLEVATVADNARDKFWRKAIPEVRKRIKLLSDRKLEANLEMAAGTLAEAYRIGVEEGQLVAIQRLADLQRKLAALESANG